jgi:hypothetical protein
MSGVSLRVLPRTISGRKIGSKSFFSARMFLHQGKKYLFSPKSRLEKSGPRFLGQANFFTPNVGVG